MLWHAVAGGALALAALALWLAVVTVRRLGTRDPLAVPPFLRRMLGIREGAREAAVAFGTVRPGRQVVAFVVNPTKPGIAQLREEAYRACSMRYLSEPLWLHTTLDEPGIEVANRAVEAGATVLVAVGGDGTVRAVAAAAAAASLPLGVIPLGTGNLLARNVGLPLTDSSAALRIALDGRESPVDMG